MDNLGEESAPLGIGFCRGQVSTSAFGQGLRVLRWLVSDLRPRHIAEFQRVWRRHGWAGIRHRLRVAHGYVPPASLTRIESQALLASLQSSPQISLVVPVLRPRWRWLRRCVDSVVHQHYARWELLLIADGAIDRQTEARLARWSQSDARVRVLHNEGPAGIAPTSNVGISAARGSFVGFLDQDDELSPDALTWMAATVDRNPQVRWLYSDEDKISRWGIRFAPHRKPDFTPELLLACMVTCHLSVYDAALLREVGGQSPGYEGAQDHDLALRISERVTADQVVHVPRILYHWRALPTSTAARTSAKPHAAESGRRAVRAALRRRGLTGNVTSNERLPTLYHVVARPRCARPITLFVEAEQTDHLVRCLPILLEACDRRNVVLVEAPTADRPGVRAIGRQFRVPVIDMVAGSNTRGSIRNYGLAMADTPLVMFVSARLVPRNADWLSALWGSLEHDASIAALGGMHIDRHDNVLHAGFIVDAGGHVHEPHRGLGIHELGEGARLQALQDVSAVDGDFVLLRREAVLQVGGYDARLRDPRDADVALGRALAEAGFRTLIQPAARFGCLKRRAALGESVPMAWQRWPATAGIGRLHSTGCEANSDRPTAASVVGAL